MVVSSTVRRAALLCALTGCQTPTEPGAPMPSTPALEILAAGVAGDSAPKNAFFAEIRVRTNNRALCAYQLSPGIRPDTSLGTHYADMVPFTLTGDTMHATQAPLATGSVFRDIPVEFYVGCSDGTRTVYAGFTLRRY